MNADDLRATAIDIRGKANAATPGPYVARPTGGGGHWIEVDTGRGPDELGEGRRQVLGAYNADLPNVQHMLAWHPAVALVVADWLEHLGDTLGDDPSDYCGGKGHEMWSSRDGVVFIDCHSWFCQSVDAAFAVVKAWRGES